MEPQVPSKSDGRPDWDEYFMGMAHTAGARGTCDRGRNGCVVVRDKRILVTGYAGAPTGLPHCDDVGHMLAVAEYSQQHEDGTVSRHCVRTTHAEQNAICQAAKFGISLENGTLYCRFVPCFVCTKMIINVGIKRVVAERRYHADENTLAFFNEAGIELHVLRNETEQYAHQK